MSSDEKKQAYGNILADYLDAKSEFIALESEAKKISAILNEIGASLQMPMLTSENYFEKYISSYPTIEKIRELYKSLTETRERKLEAEKRLKDLGVPLP